MMLRQMAEANGWETVVDPSMGTFVEELQAQLILMQKNTPLEKEKHLQSTKKSTNV